jgi:hypothetical protein
LDFPPPPTDDGTYFGSDKLRMPQDIIACRSWAQGHNLVVTALWFENRLAATSPSLIAFLFFIDPPLLYDKLSRQQYVSVSMKDILVPKTCWYVLLLLANSSADSSNDDMTLGH